MFCILLNKPNTLSNQITRTITTTALRIFLIVRCIGMYRFINQRITPVTKMTMIIFKIGIYMYIKLILIFILQSSIFLLKECYTIIYNCYIIHTYHLIPSISHTDQLKVFLANNANNSPGTANAMEKTGRLIAKYLPSKTPQMEAAIIIEKLKVHD